MSNAAAQRRPRCAVRCAVAFPHAAHGLVCAENKIEDNLHAIWISEL